MATKTIPAGRPAILLCKGAQPAVVGGLSFAIPARGKTEPTRLDLTAEQVVELEACAPYQLGALDVELLQLAG